VILHKTGLKVGLVVLFALICFGVGYNAKDEKAGDPEALPRGASATIKVSPTQVRVNTGTKISTIKVPKFGEANIKVTPKGEVIAESTSYWPTTGTRVHMGVAYSGRVEPLVGVQLVRIEPLEVGVSVDATPSMIGVSLSKDVLSNSLAGLGIGIDYEANKRVYTYFSVSF